MASPFGSGDSSTATPGSSSGDGNVVSGPTMLSKIGADHVRRERKNLDELPGDLRALVLDDLKKGGR